MLPVALDPDSLGAGDQPMSRKQLLDSGERRVGSGEEAEREVGVDSLVVEARIDPAAREDALQLRAEDEEVVGDGVVERLDPEPVACEHRAPSLGVPDREPELSS